jgi:hypothetical protein
MNSKTQQIKDLKAQVEKLLPYKQKWERTLEVKRNLHAKRRRLFVFFEYKNYHNTKPRFWPEVLCCDCVHVKPDGRTGSSKNSDRQQLTCKIIGTRVGKYSSCNQRKMAN